MQAGGPSSSGQQQPPMQAGGPSISGQQQPPMQAGGPSSSGQQQPPNMNSMAAKLAELTNTTKDKQIKDLTAGNKTLSAQFLGCCSFVRLSAADWVEQQTSLSSALQKLGDIFPKDRADSIAAILRSSNNSDDTKRSQVDSILAAMDGTASNTVAVDAYRTVAGVMLARVRRLDTPRWPLS